MSENKPKNYPENTIVMIKTVTETLYEYKTKTKEILFVNLYRVKYKNDDNRIIYSEFISSHIEINTKNNRSCQVNVKIPIKTYDSKTLIEMIYRNIKYIKETKISGTYIPLNDKDNDNSFVVLYIENDVQNDKVVSHFIYYRNQKVVNKFTINEQVFHPNNIEKMLDQYEDTIVEETL